MDDLLAGEPTTEEATKLQTAIRQHLAEIEQLREHMQRDQAQIEASGARTDAILKQIQAQLARLQAS